VKELIRRQEMENSNSVISVFKDGTNETTREKYTAVWIRLINQLANSSMFLPVKEERT
jgi:hypothetical protein